MEKDLERLIAICSPPSKPIETGAIEQWELIEQQIGVILPPDYKQFINLYGTGCFAEFIWVLNPFNDNSINLSPVPSKN